MTTASIVPSENALIETGEGFNCVITAVGATEITLTTTDGVTADTIWTLTGGFAAGYAGSASTLTGVTTMTNVKRTAGWYGSPMVFTVQEVIGGSTTAQSWTYSIRGIETYTGGKRPYNETIETGLTVTEDDIVVGTDVSQLDFDDATFNITNPATGKVTVTGLGGGGGATDLDDLGDVTITAPSIDEVLKYDGAEWVNADEDPSVTDFLSLTDVYEPDYTGHAAELVRVRSGEDGLEFAPPASGAGTAGIYGTLTSAGDSSTNVTVSTNSVGIASAVVSGSGSIAVTWGAPFSDTDYTIQATSTLHGDNIVISVVNKLVGSATIAFKDDAGADVDPDLSVVSFDILAGGFGSGDVTSVLSLTADKIVVGDDGVKGVKTSLITVDGSGNLTTGGTLQSFDVHSENLVQIEERVGAPLATAGSGKLYVESDQTLHFLDGLGGDLEVGAGGSETLEDVINGTAQDNDVNVPASDPLIMRDAAGTHTPFSLEKTEVAGPGDTAPAQVVTVPSGLDAGISIVSATGVYALTAQPSGVVFEPDPSATYITGPRTRGVLNPGSGNDYYTVAGGAYGVGNTGGDLYLYGGSSQGGAIEGNVKVGTLNTVGVEVATSGVITTISGPLVPVEGIDAIGNIETTADITASDGSVYIQGTEHSLLVEEGAQPEVPTGQQSPDMGQYWARTSDGHPMFTTSGGTDYDLSTGGGGGTLDTITAQNGIEDIGDTTDAILQPVYGVIANTLIHGNDTRLSNQRDPNTHASSHENGSGDEISIAGLSGLLADTQTVGIEDGGDPDTYDARTINFGSNLTVTVDGPDGTATVNASVSGSAGVHGLGDYNHDNTSTAGAGIASGNFRTNHATLTSVTMLFVHDTNGNSQAMSEMLNSCRGTRLSFNNPDGSEHFFCHVTGDPVDQTTYWDIPVENPVGTPSSLTNAESFSITLGPSGLQPYADAVLTDNAVVRGDGGARGTQTSSVIVTDGGQLNLTSAASAMQVEERTTGPTFVAGTGQFWVKDDAPTTPMFTGDTGTEYDLSDTTDADAIHYNVSGEVTAISEKVAPVSTDVLLIEDSGASGAKKSIQIGNLPVITGAAGALVVDARSSGGTINPGDVVYISGWNIGAGVIEVDLADASNAATMPGYGIANATITSGSTGALVVAGEILSQVTTGYTEGDALYVSETAGEFTATKPTGTALVQKIGIVNRVHSSSGVIQLVGAGRSNDLPNIAEDFLWLGDSNGVPAATARAGIDTTATAHAADTTTNPHGVSIGGTSAILSGNLAQLNAVITNATLDDASDERQPPDNSITQAKMADNAVGLAELAPGTATKYLGYDGSGNPAELDAGAVTIFGTPETNDYARFTDADTIEGRSYAEVQADLSLEIGTDVERFIPSGNTASRPGSPVADDKYVNTQTGALERYTGAAWEDVGLAVDDVTLEATTDLHVKDAGVIATTKLSATGTKDSNTFLRGDDTWDVPPNLDEMKSALDLRIINANLISDIGGEFDLSPITEETSPAAADLLLTEDGTTGAKKYLQIGDLPSSGHTIENATTPLAAREALNFPGATGAIVATDNAGTDATDITIGLSGLTAETTPVSGDLFMIELSGGGIRKIDVDDMPGGAGGGPSTPGTTRDGGLAVYDETDGTSLGICPIVASQSATTAVASLSGSALLCGGIGAGITFTASGNGSVTLAQGAESGGGAVTMTNSGTLLMGSASATAGSSSSTMSNAGVGTTVIGRVDQPFVGTSEMSADNTSHGGYCGGFISYSGTIKLVGAHGGHASGYAVGGNILCSGEGGFAHGETGTGDITASGDGAVAFGLVTTGDITASGDGSAAFGAPGANSLVASATNSFQFGPGTNAESTSLAVGNIGSGGVRLIGDGAAAGTPANGDIYVVSGKVYVHTNGTARLLGVGAT